MKKITAILASFAMLISLGTTASAEVKYKSSTDTAKNDNFTYDEMEAIYTASEFVSLQNDNMYVACHNDTLAYTIDQLEDSEKEFIIQKAEENEDEIRVNHVYYDYWPGRDPMIYFPEYETVPMRTLIDTYPDYLVQYERYGREYNYSFENYIMYYSNISGKSIYLSDSGFAYVTLNDILDYQNHYGDSSVWVQVLMYHLDDKWIICDVLKPTNRTNENNFGHNYRFNLLDDEELDQEIVKAYTLALEAKNKDGDNTKETAGENEPEEPVQDENNSQDENKPINYTPWVICTAEGVAIIALVIALVLKKKK